MGRHVTAALVAREHEVINLRLPAAVHMVAPDVLVHLAAVVGGIGFNQAHPWECVSRNADLALQAVAAARHWGCKIVAIGSVCAYPKHTPVPFQEGALWSGYPEETNAPYGVAKRLLLELCRSSGVPWTYLLPANLYGPGDHYGDRAHVIPDIIAKMEAARRSSSPSVTLWGDGTPTREFLYAPDCAGAIAAAVEREPTMEPVNVGTGRETRISHLAHVIADVAGYRGSILWDPSRPNGQPRRCLNVFGAKALLGWRATTLLEDGIERAVEDYRACGPAARGEAGGGRGRGFARDRQVVA